MERDADANADAGLTTIALLYFRTDELKQMHLTIYSINSENDIISAHKLISKQHTIFIPILSSDYLFSTTSSFRPAP